MDDAQQQPHITALVFDAVECDITVECPSEAVSKLLIGAASVIITKPPL